MFKNQLSKLTFVFICLGLLVSLKPKSGSFSKIKTKSKSAFIDTGDLWAEKVLNSMTLEEKVGQFFMVATWSEKDETHQAEIEKKSQISCSKH